MTQTRVTLNGLRHYVCNGVPKPLPSVTSILSTAQTEKTRQKLVHWNLMNPGVADQAAERGNWVHSSVENYLKGLRVVPPEKYKLFWDDLPELVDKLMHGGRVLWSEKPFNQPKWSKYVGDDGVGRGESAGCAAGGGAGDSSSGEWECDLCVSVAVGGC